MSSAISETPAWPYYQRIAANFSRSNQLLAAGLSRLLSLVPGALFAWDLAAPARPGNYGLVIFLAVLHLPAILFCGVAISRHDRVRFEVGYFALSLIQLLWLSFWAWLGGVWFTILAVMILCGWVYNDAWVFRGARVAILPYLFWVPLFNLILVAMDAYGYVPGYQKTLGARWWEIILFEIWLVGLCVFILSKLGAEYRKFDETAQALEETRRQQARADVFKVMARFSTSGILATQICHDLRNPLQKLVGNLDEIKNAGTAPTLETLTHMEVAVAELINQTAAIARAPKTAPEPVGQDVEQLMGKALKIFEHTCTLRGMTYQAPKLNLASGFILAPGSLDAILANLLVNSSEQTSAAPVDIEGSSDGDRYEFRLRDYALDDDARRVALERIKKSLSFDIDDLRDRRGGYGVALIVAEAALASVGGTIEYEAPATGRGVICKITCPLGLRRV